MYAQNPMFSGVSPGRMAEARRFAQGGQMGRAKQQFELGGGQWNPQVHRGLRQQDSIGGMIGGPPPGRPGGPGMHTNWPTPGGDIHEGIGKIGPDIGGGPGWGFGQHNPFVPAQPGMGGGGMRQPGFVPGGPDDPEMGGSGYMTRPGMGGGHRWGAFPGMGGIQESGVTPFPSMPPRFGGGSPAGMGRILRHRGAFGRRPSAGPPMALY